MSVQLFDLDKDIVADSATTRARKHIAAEKSICLFDPGEHDSKHSNYQLSKYALSE